MTPPEALRRGDVAALRRRGHADAEGTRSTSSRRSTWPRRRRSLRSSTASATPSRGRSSTAKAGWRDVKIDRLNPTEIGAWRKALPARSAFGIHKALRQVLHYAVRAKLLDENPPRSCRTRSRERTEVQTFSLGELVALSGELSHPFRAIPVFAALTGLRPCEWIALERADIDRQAGVVTVRRTVVEGVAKPYGKTERSLRAVPLPARAAEALDEHLPRLDTRVLFPGARGGPLALSPFRHRRMEPGTPRRWRRAPFALRDAAHLREPLDRRRSEPLRALSAHGHVARDARQDVRAHAPGRARSCSLGARRVRLGTFRGLRGSRRFMKPHNRAVCEWARLDSNQGPTDYESAALTS